MPLDPAILAVDPRRKSGVMARVPRRPREPKEEVVRALVATGGNVSEAARMLGRNRELVHRWMRLYGIRHGSKRRA